MAIEVKQLTINTSIGSAEEKSDDVEESKGREKINDACTDVENIKIDIIAECQRLIKASLERVGER